MAAFICCCTLCVVDAMQCLIQSPLALAQFCWVSLSGFLAIRVNLADVFERLRASYHLLHVDCARGFSFVFGTEMPADGN